VSHQRNAEVGAVVVVAGMDEDEGLGLGDASVVGEQGK